MEKTFISLKSLLYHFLKFFGPVLPNFIFTNFLFFLNCIRLKRPFYILHYSRPKSFNEKINYIKFYRKNSIAPIVADKILVREFVKKKIGAQYLIPIISIFENPFQIDFSILPNQFVMKLNNGSGYNLICDDINRINKNELIRNFSNAFNKDMYVMSREWHYSKITPKIIVEELLGFDILDFKFFCFKNRGPVIIQVDYDRFSNHRRDFFNLNWERLPYKLRYENSTHPCTRPEKLEEMLRIASLLSQDFIFSRVDLYHCNGKIYFGEITIHPGGGVEPFDSYKSDYDIGQFLQF